MPGDVGVAVDTSRRVRLEELAWPEVREYLTRRDVVLFPVGATEQHGWHLPLGTDAMVAERLAIDAAKVTATLVAPALYYGWSPHHMAYPGTVSLRPESMAAVVDDVCRSLVKHGFHKIIIVNGHRQANLPPLQIAAARIREETGAYVAIADPFYVAELAGRRLRRSAPGGIGHADELETATMMVLRPELVQMEKAVRNVPPERRFHQPDPYVEADRVFVPSTTADMRARGGESGVVGDPTVASQEQGAEYYRCLLANLVDFIHEVERFEVSGVEHLAGRMVGK